MGQKKKYAVWLEIEEATLYNGVESDYFPSEPLPACIGEFETLKEAKLRVEQVEYLVRMIKENKFGPSSTNRRAIKPNAKASSISRKVRKGHNKDTGSRRNTGS